MNQNKNLIFWNNDIINDSNIIMSLANTIQIISSSVNWKSTYSTIINEMWLYEMKKNAGGFSLCAFCPTYNYSSMTNCLCVEKKYKQNLTFDDLIVYLNQTNRTLEKCTDAILNPYKIVLTCGAFYSPSGRHYGNESNNVQCDRCRVTGLSCCIGYEKMDLCMNCASIVSKTL